MKKFTNFIRVNAGKKNIPKFYRKHLSEKIRALEDIYKISQLNFDIPNKKGNNKSLRYIVYADAEELLNKILEERSEDGNVLVKVMADGGQGFFKICFTVIPEIYPDELNESHDGFFKQERSKYKDGGSFSKLSKLTGVNKLIMLCCVSDVKETYGNIKLLFDITRLNNIPFKFVSDFKLILIVNGKQTATSKYPSPYCFITLNELRDISEDAPKCYNKEERCFKLLTYGDLKEAYDKFKQYGYNKKYAMDAHSCINQPLFEEDDDVFIIEKCIPPELHMLQGFVNHLFWDGIVPLLGKEKALLWPKMLKLVPKNYQGDIF